MGALGVVAAIGAGLFWLRGRQAERNGNSEVPLKNPFSLTSAIKFAALFTLIEVIVKLAQTYLPQSGFYAIAGIAGLTDVDAITLSMSEYAQQGGSAAVATRSIVIATISNTLVKCGLVALWGGRRLALRVGLATGAILIAGIVAAVFMPPGEEADEEKMQPSARVFRALQETQSPRHLVDAAAL
jgi:uncharacterized membrane protein (DUF4010 family)